MQIHQILTQYWGHSQFRPLQEDIIQSVLQGYDSLALLPTGGGKSICFQVPAMAKEGLCLVISPLIALMKDQVENLKKRGIKASAVYSGMTSEQIDIALENAVFDKEIKFLYISPERLLTSLFRERMKRMNVNLIAVDEAHCVSQWGYDFRPPYLKIAEIRQFLPGVPILALTATATPEVVVDIQKQLGFISGKVFQKSFERKNLTYYVRKDENKLQTLLNIINKVRGCGIVYVRSRQRTRNIADFLNKNNIKSDYYHAGLEHKVRDKKQQAWKNGVIQVIVATNAFGMGIDKPDVRFVIHLDLPDCIESYFQEAGRAGRDEKKAFGVLLYENSDVMDLYKYHESSFPEPELIKKVYNQLGNFFQIPVGSGRDCSFEFNLATFSEQYGFNPVLAYNALKFLEKEGYLALSESFNEPSKIHITANKTDLYKFQLQYPQYDNFVKLILRMYTGVFNDYVRIDEAEISAKSELPFDRVQSILKELQQLNLIHYIARTDKPYLHFTCERVDSKDVLLSQENFQLLKDRALMRLEAMTDYISVFTKCRSSFLLEYFGEKNVKRCGTCDVCQKRNELGITEYEFDKIILEVRPMLETSPSTLEEIVALISDIPHHKVIKVVQWLTDNNKLTIDNELKYRWMS
jgi:ATP-dependent DNA helicase RecQ